MNAVTRTAGTAVLLLAGMASVAARPAAGQSCTPTWDVAIGQPGLTGTAYALKVFDDGTGPALYVGGYFDRAGGAEGIVVNHIAKWDGSQWQALASGLSNAVYAMEVYDDGTGPALYVGGSFQTASGVSARNLAKWDGSQWDDVGGSLSDGLYVSALALFDDGNGEALYAGGRFTTAGGGVSANRIARWDGSAWTALDTGLNNNVNSLAATNDFSAVGPGLYVGGKFTVAGGATAYRIAKWGEERGWSSLGLGMNNSVLALAIFDDGTGPAVYAGGKFTVAGTVNANYIARWDGSAWSTLGTGATNGMNERVNALAVFDDGVHGPALYAAGDFTQAGGEYRYYVARWEPSTETWSPLGDGVNDEVQTLGLAEDDAPGAPGLYLGGFFTSAGDELADHIARWMGCVTADPGDCDADGDIDVDDYATFQGCITGPTAGGVVPGCECANLDGDVDIDLEDLVAFQNVFSGS